MRAPRGAHEIMTLALCRSCRANDRNHWDINVIGALGPGWQGVRAYLQGPSVTVVAALCDVLIVHVDADVRRASAIEKTLREPDSREQDLDPLCEHVKSWFAGGVPPNAIVVLPREATDAWLLAARSNVTDVEADPAPATTLKAMGLIGTRRDGPSKEAAIYKHLAGPLAGLVLDKKRLDRVPELARFMGKLRSRAHALRRAKKDGHM
jgi:hypothetical protein